MRLDVIFDTVCPWCFIGKRRLQKAIAMRPEFHIDIVWHPFLLNPDMPSGGIDRTAYLIKKIGSETRVRRIYGAIGEAGQSVEIDFAFDRIGRTPNSVDSHRLIRYAAQTVDAAPLVEALFSEYFLNGGDIGDTDVLIEIGIRHGLEPKTLRHYLASDEDVDAIYEDNARAHRLGVNGVPAFAFDGAMVISGAQEPEVLVRVMDAAHAARPVHEEMSA